MEKTLNRNLTLAIESALGGGSLSIYQYQTEVAFMVNQSSRSKAEELLSDIEFLLSKNSLKKNEIGKVIISGGPGSRTGIRIGAATAKGLVSALVCDFTEVSLLNALAFAVNKTGKIRTAVQISKETFSTQMFEKTLFAEPKSAPEMLPFDELNKRINENKAIQTIIATKFKPAEFGNLIITETVKIIDGNENLAGLLAIADYTYEQNRTD